MATSSPPPASPPPLPSSPAPPSPSTSTAPPAFPAEPETTIHSLLSELESLRAQLSTSHSTITTQTTRLLVLADLESELNTLRTEHAFLKAAKEAVEVQLKDERAKREEAEEGIEALRGQVEQARRGVMTLQMQEKERKRMSTLGGGLGLTGGGGVEAEEVILAGVPATEGTSRLAKRQSIMRGHRRVSSQSEPAEALASPTLPTAAQGGTTKGGLRELRLGTGVGGAAVSTSPGSSAAAPLADEQPPAPAMTKRSSSSGLQSSPPTTQSQSQVQPIDAEEAARLKGQVAALNRRLAESEEARQASEDCLRALREFMAAGGAGGAESAEEVMKGLRLPPLPTDREAEDDAQAVPGGGKKAGGGGGGGWGFKLWNKGAGPGPTSPGEAPATPQPAVSSPPAGTTPLAEDAKDPAQNAVTPLASFVSGWTRGVAPGTPGTAAPPTIGARKITSFFGRGSGGSRKVEEEADKDLPAVPVRGGLEPSLIVEGHEGEEADGEGQGKKRRSDGSLAAESLGEVSPRKESVNVEGEEHGANEVPKESEERVA